MKYTHLFGAAALAVAMGTQGLALTETNTVYTQDFDGVDTTTYTLMSDLALTGWSDPTASGEDADKSFLVAAPVSVSATDGYEGYAGKHLELNTDGHELVYTPTSGAITNTTAQISMRVRLVGSESDPTGLDTDVHSAVSLKTDENDPTFAALYAYTWSAEGETNEWVALNTTGLAGLANGAVLALRVTMDYADQEATYEGVIVTADPDADSVALLYDMGQDSSTTPIAEAKAFLDEKQVAYKDYNGTTVDEVMLAVDALIADGVDAVFTPTDNTIMTAELSIYEALAEAGIPHYTGADSFALNGAFVGYGVDYANLGLETGSMIAMILLEGANPADTPVLTFDNGTATVNTETCEALGLDYDAIAEAFAPLCTQVLPITTAESFSDLAA